MYKSKLKVELVLDVELLTEKDPEGMIFKTYKTLLAEKIASSKFDSKDIFKAMRRFTFSSTKIVK